MFNNEYTVCRKASMTEKKEANSSNIHEALETVKDPELKKILTRISEQIIQDGPHKEVEEFKKKITKTTKQPIQQVFSHEMAKVSIFFPISDKELKEENRRIHRVEQKSNWGKVVIEGVKLAIFEEDVFLAIMKIGHKKTNFINGQYSLETNIKNIIHLLYGTSNYSSKKVVASILRTLDHFQLVKFSITLFTKKRAGEKELKEDGFKGSIGNIVQSYYYDPVTHNLKIKFNPDFYVFFMESMLTNINFTIRRHLKKDGAKALLRFLTAHNKPTRMHILTVLKAINYNIEQPMYTLRRKFKQFIAELKKVKVLGSKTKLYPDDTVFFDILANPKTFPI